jgi:FtsZ-interacting cell division protein YlmF
MMNNNDIEEKNSIDPTDENGDNEDSKVQQRDSARTKDSSVVDITKSDNTSKDILDITDTPDVAVWNKSVQKKNSMANHLKEREYGEAQTIGIGLRNNVTMTMT